MKKTLSAKVAGDSILTIVGRLVIGLVEGGGLRAVEAFLFDLLTWLNENTGAKPGQQPPSGVMTDVKTKVWKGDELFSSLKRDNVRRIVGAWQRTDAISPFRISVPGTPPLVRTFLDVLHLLYLFGAGTALLILYRQDVELDQDSQEGRFQRSVRLAAPLSQNSKRRKKTERGPWRLNLQRGEDPEFPPSRKDQEPRVRTRH